METPIHMPMLNKIPDSRALPAARIAGLGLLAIGLLALAGCSSSISSSQPQVGAIAFTDANATAQKPLTALTVSQGTYLDVTMTSDPKLLGANWTALCGSALPPGTPLPPGQTQDQSCGTFTPAHTISAPLPSYASNAAGYVTFYTAPTVPPKQGVVTLYASATSDPSQFTSVTLTIGGLPISVGFAPAPPSSLGLSTSTQLKAVLSNDATGAGVNWTVICTSSACGSFSSAQTASGALTTYTTPASVPGGGSVLVTATSVADPTKSATASIQIVPISVSVTPAVLSVPTAGTAPLTAIVANDGLNKGVDWTVSCTNTTTPGVCGTITSHTANGAKATYTAPGLASISAGSNVLITATSTTDPTRSATSTVTTIQGNLVAGTVQAAERPVVGAQVSLYAAASREVALPAVAAKDNITVVTTATTGQNGDFSIPGGYTCPRPDQQMYLVSFGGDSGAGTNHNFSLMAALGSCSQLDAAHFVLNEATTVAAVYALSGLIIDARHVGSGNTSSDALAAAFATAKDLVDVATGAVRTRSVSGTGIVPQGRINLLASFISACAVTSGSAEGDGGACDQLFQATDPDTTQAAQPDDTLTAMLNLARHATLPVGGRDSAARLYRLAATNVSAQPVLPERGDWTLAIRFPATQDEAVVVPSTLALQPAFDINSAGPTVDAAGNVWLRGKDQAVLEFVGAASCVGAPAALIPIAAAMAEAP